MSRIHAVSKERLEALIAVSVRSRVSEPPFSIERFYIVFGNLIQEYFADRIWEEIRSSVANPTRDVVVRLAFTKAEEWFGTDFSNEEMPFTRWWLKKYMEGRFFGYRTSRTYAAKVERGKREFESRHPKNQCQWYLGCTMTEEELAKRGETLHCDHKWPLAWNGPLTPENCQWLCRKHNVLWKGKSVFWGENSILCGQYQG